MTLMAILQIVVAILVVLYAIRRFWLELLLPAFKFGRKAVHVTDIMIEIPDRLKTLEERTSQLTANGGTHLSDDIRETKRLLETHIVWSEGHVNSADQRITTLESEVWQAMIRRNEQADKRDELADLRDIVAANRDLIAEGRDTTAGRRDDVAGRRDSTAGHRDDVAQIRDDVRTIRDEYTDEGEY